MRNTISVLVPAAIFAFGAISVANATIVTYGTSGVFNCSTVANCVAAGNIATVGGLTLNYQAQASTTVNASPVASANFGSIIVSGGSTTALTVLSNLLLDITINQTGPYSQSTGVFNGILTGVLGITGGNSDGFATICFVASSACANQVEAITYAAGDPSITYKLQTPQNPNAPPANGYTIRATSSKLGDPTSFQGSIAAPEPSSYFMLASGLLALGTISRRKNS